MIKTHGLTHIALAVRDPRRSLRFYRTVFGMKTVYSSPDFVQLQTPGTHDVLVFEKSATRTGRSGGVAHFGFRLHEARDIGPAVRAVKRAGGRILSQGEFCPGEPYLFAGDPDGYELEIWYELPTPLDPPARRGERPKSAPRRSAPRGVRRA